MDQDAKFLLTIIIVAHIYNSISLQMVKDDEVLSIKKRGFSVVFGGSYLDDDNEERQNAFEVTAKTTKKSFKAKAGDFIADTYCGYWCEVSSGETSLGYAFVGDCGKSEDSEEKEDKESK